MARGKGAGLSFLRHVALLASLCPCLHDTQGRQRD
jgi:hypothetical protein